MSASLNLKGLTFLVADSDRFFLDLIRSILRSFGAQNILVSQSGEKAMAIAEGGSIDFIICDAFLEDIDGFSLCRKMRHHSKHELTFVPIIVLTSHTQLDTVLRARDSGASMVLAKPISPATVFARLVWLANDARAFVKCGGFLGPDRRFKNAGPPDSGERRQVVE